MRVEVRSHDFPVTPGIQTRADRRLRFALGRFGDSIDKVVVRLKDLNGPHGGVDKQCSIEVGFRRGGKCLLEDVDPDMYAAIDRAADRAGRMVRRRQRRRARPKGKPEAAWWALAQPVAAREETVYV